MVASVLACFAVMFVLLLTVYFVVSFAVFVLLLLRICLVASFDDLLIASLARASILNTSFEE